MVAEESLMNYYITVHREGSRTRIAVMCAFSLEPRRTVDCCYSALLSTAPEPAI